MEDIRFQFYRPVTTGTPGFAGALSGPGLQPKCSPGEKSSFQEILSRKLQENSSVTFSKHAVKRAVENNIQLTEESLARLQEGVRLAGEKNLEDTLILVGPTAFLVNVKNNTVITAVDSSGMRGNVFTNIDGTVIV